MPPTPRRPLPKPKSKKKSKAPETFDDFIEAGIDSEEQGERYGTGERAVHYYGRAASQYGQAYALKSDDADCLYNWGRVLYILVGLLPAHTPADEKIKQLDEAIAKFRQVLKLERGKTDAQFNLAQALHMRSEILQESSEIENSYSQSAMALQEAIELFERVYGDQENEYKNQRHVHEDASASDSETHAAPKDTSETTHEAEPEATPSDATTANQDDNEEMTVTEVEPTTVYSLIETLVCLGDTLTTMASMLASFQTSVNMFSKARTQLATAEKWLATVPTDQHDTKEYAHARIQIHLKEAQSFSALADRTMIASSKVDHQLYNVAVERLDAVLAREPRHVEALCDRGDVLMAYGDACTRQDGPLPKDVWQILSKADKSYKEALAIEPKNLGIINKLGDLSMIRSMLDLPVAERNRAQLLKNAEFYYKLAVETDRQDLMHGWIGWALSTWALEEWADVPGKRAEATKILNTWVKRGGTNELFGNIAEDSEILDEEFVEWVNDEFF